MKKTVRRLLLLVAVIATVMLCLAFSASAANEEYALFPLNELKIVRTNTALDADQIGIAMKNGGHVKYAFDLSGGDTKVKAPFTGKVLFVDKGGAHSIFFQSVNKVRLANGKTDYLTCVFVHDDDVSNVKVGKVYKQGEYICDQGTFGNGKKGTYDRHLHLEVAVGKLDISTKYTCYQNLNKVRSSKNGIHVHQALFLKSNTKRTKDYIKVVCQNNKIVKLNWKTVSEVSYNANGGSISPTKQNYEVGKTYSFLPTPTRSGYKFKGWYTSKTGGEKMTTSTKVTKGNKTLYAQWSVVDKNKLYYVAYNKNGGIGSMSRIEVVANEYFVSGPNKFTRSGYVFKGWNLRRKSDNKWYISGKGWHTDTIIKMFGYTKKVFKDNYKYKLDSYWMDGSAKNETFELYAVWSKCTSHKWDAGKVTTAATTIKTGVKTYTCTNCKKAKTETIARSTTEKYFSNVYANNIKTNDAKIGGKFAKLTYIKTTGFYFGTSKDSLKRITKNLKGKADGSGNFKEIFFTLSGWYEKLNPGTTYYYSVFYIDKNGKECASVIKSFKTSGTSASTAVKAYTFAYNANGGGGSVSSQTVQLNNNFTVKANGFTRSGYTFTGYYVQRKSDGKWFVEGKGWKSGSDITSNKWSKKLYKPGAVLNVNNSWQSGSKTGETFTFFAQWSKQACTSHKWDSGKVTTAATTVKTGVKTYTCTNCKATKTEVIARSTTEKYFSNVYANNISANDAKIGGKFAKLTYMKTTGFYFGTSKDSLKRITKNLKGKADGSGNFYEIFFTLSGWYGKLSPNTTYYYSVFYIDKNGKECASVIKSFITPGYTFLYNANGGSGSVSSQTVQLNQNLTVKANGFTRSGYTFVGYYAQRKSDGKWYVAGQGWKTESEISKNNWSKKLYAPGIVLNINSSWQANGRTSENITFWAQWKK